MALVIVQSTKDEGSFTLSASSDGLSGSNISVKTVKNAVEGDAYLQSYTIAKNYMLMLVKNLICLQKL